MTIDITGYSALEPSRISYYIVCTVMLLLVLLGAYCAYQMEHAGHHISGMNNHVVWGLPHVFAVSLIVAASGALNAASFSSVFGATLYRPYARLSVVLALALLLGGLAVLVLDLGRPDRLVIALTHYNFRSIFAWNIFLYAGFLLLGVVYLTTLMERRLNHLVSLVGTIAFIWRLVLTTGTGSIFGYLVGRDALDSALLAPLFIALSMVLGMAVFALMMITILRWQQVSLLPKPLADSLCKLLLWFVLSVAYFSIVHHLANLYVTEHHAVEKFMLAGPLAWLFWLGHIGLGVLLPVYLLLLASRESASRERQQSHLLLASIASIAGSGMLVYTIIIGSQSTAQRLFPGKTVIASRFGDAGFASYGASAWEWGLGLGGLASALLVLLLLLRLLPFTPEPQ